MWKDIPLSDKQRMMELAVKSGITDLRTIEEVYNKYAEGGKIHINPENKGKFNATKERTGKTTEELTHSKNPLTRKRAIFAQNAKKWHHKDLGGTLMHSFAGDEDNYLMLNPAILYANPSNIFQRAYNKLENFYWHKLRAPKDYSDETTKEEQCARWANQQLRNKGKQIFGNAWTRSNNPVTKVASGYDGLIKPTEYNERNVLDYLYTAANNIKKNKAFNKRNIANTLQEGDMVGLYFRNSPNLKTAFDEGINGEAQTHTGNIVIENEIPYVVHNVHGNIIKNKASDLLGSRHPYGIVSIYRPKALGGILLSNFNTI